MLSKPVTDGVVLRLYPSNKLEHLVSLLASVREHVKGADAQSPLRSDIILVESLGMQHWLNMTLARQHGIAMNIQYPMPTRFMWNVARAVLGDQRVPKQSPYKREVLCWRIYALLTTPNLLTEQKIPAVADYFSRVATPVSKLDTPYLRRQGAAQSAVKQLQFSRALADVYEQYMLYRPDWLAAWEAGHSVAPSEGLSASDEQWQAAIWRLLVQQQPLHPAMLHRQAIDALTATDKMAQPALPEHLYVFAINTMAPQLVAFLDALANHCDIHVFHLNPCVNYWGDFQTDKQSMRTSLATELARWGDERTQNPLLANMGQQGRDLFTLLNALPNFEVSAFEAPLPSDASHSESAPSGSLLNTLQQAIFEGVVVPDTGTTQFAQCPSVTVVKAHSALRELQGLHDFLLAEMQHNPSIKPHDIVVMCPAIEDYAPFIPAIFQLGQRRFTSSSHRQEGVRIPCSIADRTPLDSLPEVSAFLSLLTLPDSRFSVTDIIAYLRLPAIQNKFAINDDELTLINHWLSRANIRWGLSGEHKQQFVTGAQAEPSHSWSWGLERLLVGFAQCDAQMMQNELLTVPDAEGKQAETLGKLCWLLEQLSRYADQLLAQRSVPEWQRYLRQLQQSFLAETQDNQFILAQIERVIGTSVEHVNAAGYNDKVPLSIMRDALNHNFATPDAINQFMTGQVTFCSMQPMRSIPFKVIALLGLNDGEFPRVSTPFSIDLMQSASRRLGDRSRRGDDRYLFLESIISARHRLYLSYQASSVKDNSERQPSLVLRELCDYIRSAFSHPQNAAAPVRTYTLPLHPFNTEHFAASPALAIPSFDPGWLRLANTIQQPQQSTQQAEYRLDVDMAEDLSIMDITRALHDPLRCFANKSLGLYLDDRTPDLLDSEPFAIDTLGRYRVLSAMVEHAQTQQESTEIDPLRWFIADGMIPSDSLSIAEVESWQHTATLLANTVSELKPEYHALRYDMKGVQITGNVYYAAPNEHTDSLTLIAHQVTEVRAHHQVNYRLAQMLTALSTGQSCRALVFDIEEKQGNLSVRQAAYPEVTPEHAFHQLEATLSAYANVLQAPQLLHCELGKALVDSVRHLDAEASHNTTITLADAWQKLMTDERSPLLRSAYFEWFFTQAPEFDEQAAYALLSLYDTLYPTLGRRSKVKES
ncbi:exodeoxyribonuclease V subunit gamma [Alteromonas oceanisediminis]|uniref:exodeoxyribonuclease V subunit gamma n=1 Tax=Alteromonas oceanisediminis TaxID=2836180 RepID=UPI001BD997DB|nr:exodeoxyribonuclease V subunit gamma [Alteromonas oceanisediminis]MBT0587347.1 exodeoxyribonuclease V subunit gamma [Alteromonas oceanisediminis]